MTIFCCIESTFTGMPEYIKHMILNTLHVFYIWTNIMYTTLIYFTIYPFLVCVQVNALPEQYSIFIFKSVVRNIPQYFVAPMIFVCHVLENGCILSNITV